MSASDLWRLEQPIVAHYSGAGINAELLSTAIRGQWRGKLREKGHELLGCLDGAPIPPMSAWASKNWPWLFCCCLLLWARENNRQDVESRVWEWVEATLEEQRRGGRWMDAEAFSRVYLHHQLSPVVCLWRESEFGVAGMDALSLGEIRHDLHAWIVTAATALALTTCGGKSAMIGARSVSDPPAHLANWVGDKILAALRAGTNPYEDDGSLSSKAHRAMWGGYVLRARAGKWEDVEELPGVLGVWELYRYESGVLWVCRDTTGLAVNSTDPGLAGWSGEGRVVTTGGAWSKDDVAFWWAAEDGRRTGGVHHLTDIGHSASSIFVRCVTDDMGITVFPGAKLLYVLRWDSSGCRRVDGETLRNEEESAGGYNSTENGTGLAGRDWPEYFASGNLGREIRDDPAGETIRLILWRILHTGGPSERILAEIEHAFFGPRADEEMARLAALGADVEELVDEWRAQDRHRREGTA